MEEIRKRRRREVGVSRLGTAETPSSLDPESGTRLLRRPRGSNLEFDAAVVAVAAASLSLVLAVTLGETVGGVTWMATLGIGLIVVAGQPLPVGSLKQLSPILLVVALAVASMYWTPDFAHGVQTLAQLAVLPVCFLVGWKAWVRSPAVVDRLSRVALLAMPLALVVFVSALSRGQFRFGWLVGNAARPMVMALAILFVIASMGRSRTVAAAAAGVALLAALASGGRMGFFVVVLLLVASPAIGLSWRARVALMAAGVVALSFVVQTDAFQDRFFVGREEGTLSDILLIRGNFNTAGRAANWPRILDGCNTDPLIGGGLGATERITLSATNGVTVHPHNEFIRHYCDLGIVGSALYWAFFLVAGWRGLRDWWKRRSLVLAPAAFQAVLALIAFSITDNVTIYTSAFMAPAALVIGMAAAERAQSRSARPSNSFLLTA